MGARLAGITLALANSSLVATSNVLCEYLFKKCPRESIPLQNVQLYLWGVLLNGIALLLKRRFDLKSPLNGPDGFSTGYNLWVVLVVLCGCIHGLLLSITMRFLDNIVVVYAHSVSMLAVTVISATCFGLKLSPINAAGILLVVISASSYH